MVLNKTNRDGDKEYYFTDLVTYIRKLTLVPGQLRWTNSCLHCLWTLDYKVNCSHFGLCGFCFCFDWLLAFSV